MFNFEFDSKMRTAWVLLSLFFLTQTLLRLIRPSEPPDVKLALVAITALNPGIILYLLQVIRGPNRDWRDRSVHAARLSVWGWFWRALILYFTPIPLMLLAEFVLQFKINFLQFSGLQIVLWEVPFLVLVAFSTWLLFSRDRRGQVKVLLASVRGY